MTTSKMEKKPAVTMDKAPEEKNDMCQCEGVTRWYSGDGEIKEKGETFYQCRQCGKKYK